ncbi:MAG: hypothetical protein AB7F86_08950 [Bdellovibrionales bacterium]
MNGRLLASRLDPYAEAEAWLDKRSLLLDRVRGVFVLGAGSGYHLQALWKRTDAQILVIEREADLARAVHSLFPESKERVEWIMAQDLSDVRTDKTVRKAIAQSFVVLEHYPSQFDHPEFYQECKRLLVGRNWGSLTWQWKLKGLPALDETPRVSQTGEPLSIYDLEQTELVQNSDEREKLLIKALRELVK